MTSLLAIFLFPAILGKKYAILKIKCGAYRGKTNVSLKFSTTNCSQTKLVSIILILLVLIKFFAGPLFRLTHLTFDPQKQDKQEASSWHYVLLEPLSPSVAKCAIHKLF